jgi:hypothetical protein
MTPNQIADETRELAIGVPEWHPPEGRMMAHLRNIERDCAWPGCPARAVEQLYSNRNDALGFYCRRHAKQALKRREESERSLQGASAFFDHGLPGEEP